MTNHGNTLNANQILNENDYLSSGNGYYAVLQADGNFVLYVTQHWVMGNARWSSHSYGKGVALRRIIMQSDGNLVIYDGSGAPTWYSNTCNKGVKPHRLVLQADGNMVIYDGENHATWDTHTNV